MNIANYVISRMKRWVISRVFGSQKNQNVETRLEVIRRNFSLLLFEGDDDNYKASCQVHQYGDVGIVYAIQGRPDRLFRNWPKIIQRLKDEGLTRLEGYQNHQWAKSMQLMCEHWDNGKVTLTRQARTDGQDRWWVVIEI